MTSHRSSIMCSSLLTEVFSSTDETHHHQSETEKWAEAVFLQTTSFWSSSAFAFLFSTFFLVKMGYLLTVLHVTTQNCRSKTVSAVKEALTIKNINKKEFLMRSSPLVRPGSCLHKAAGLDLGPRRPWNTARKKESKNVNNSWENVFNHTAGNTLPQMWPMFD